MGENIVLSIGVARAGRLPELPGAVAGAKAFIDWASRPNPYRRYDCHLVTDEQAPVTIQSLCTTIEGLLEDDIDRFLVFFSGHGIATAAGDFWLLSNWERSSNEAVNLTLSFNNARRWPIGQIAVFADACRCTDPNAVFVGGSSIFPRARVTPRRQPQWDQFLATRLGDIAQEVPNADPAKAYGVFSRCLLQALFGEVREAFEQRTGDPAQAVTSQALATWLEEVVPVESGRIPGAAVQYPDIVPSWRQPENFYLGLSQYENLRGNDAAPGSVPPLPPLTDFNHTKQAVDEARAQLDQAVETQAARFAAGRARVSFETRQGLTIIGDEVMRIAVGSKGRADLFREAGAWHVRGYGYMPQTIALRLSGGNWVATVILPDFIGGIVVEDGLAGGLNYVLSGSPDEAMEQSELVFRWTALMAQGRPIGRQGLRRVSDELRMQKHGNPAFGILAAYGFERAGRPDRIRLMLGHFAKRRQILPFDIALLSGLPLRRYQDAVITFSDDMLPAVPELFSEQRPPRIGGTFPLLRQGWALLDSADEAIHPALSELRAGLLPGAWTTLEAAAGERLAMLIERGEL